jgi:hypothetical protein
MKTTTNSTNWSQIYALAALNAAVVISWIAYHNYQPKLLEKFEFTALSNFLTMAQALVLIVIPPLAGFVADAVFSIYRRHWRYSHDLYGCGIQYFRYIGSPQSGFTVYDCGLANFYEYFS